MHAGVTLVPAFDADTTVHVKSAAVGIGAPATQSNVIVTNGPAGTMSVPTGRRQVSSVRSPSASKSFTTVRPRR
jgi:hypothetical protein